VISRLIGNSHIPEAYWRFLEIPLLRAMTNDDFPASEATRNQVAERLIVAGSESNAALAKTALRILVALSDGGSINITPFLSDNQRQRLIKNYKALVTPDSVGNKQATLESQLGLRPY
jgi:hypothetical protein